ncbi:hypothetical protein [Bryobacter aggregatus]|uniref:hypothetical protein n=1 Tax=Bryobacter aggregatus TaxID=360054 RepID=UPI0012BAB395|nr:hypothetical protein [Bryobacter aggregatus]
MRNIRLFVEFASVVMPGAVLLLIALLLFAPKEWMASDFASSGLGITTGLVFSFAIGHLLQGFGQFFIEPLWPRVQIRTVAEWAMRRFAGREKDRYLTPEQIEQLEQQYPFKLGIPFPDAKSLDAATLESSVAHAEAYLAAAKGNERLDDLSADYKLNKGLFMAFLLISISLAASLLGLIPVNTGSWTLGIFATCVIAGLCSFVRMDYHSRKYAQTLFLQFLATVPAGREGSGKGEGGGGGMPMGFGAGTRGRLPHHDDDAA